MELRRLDFFHQNRMVIKVQIIRNPEITTQNGIPKYAIGIQSNGVVTWFGGRICVAVKTWAAIISFPPCGGIP
jgi:hypothetical protein